MMTILGQQNEINLAKATQRHNITATFLQLSKTLVFYLTRLFSLVETFAEILVIVRLDQLLVVTF